MSTTTHPKLKIEDYRKLPEWPLGPLYQLIDGELIMTPAPTFEHQDAVMNIAVPLRQHAQARGLGKVIASPLDVYLSKHDVVQPDALFISRRRKDRIRKDGVHGAPDLVVEVLSPRRRKLDLGPKRRLYAKHGVVEAWYVDLKERRLLVYRFQESATKPARVLGPGDTLTTDLLPGFSLPVASIFPGE